ncbi:MAG: DUF72 domain-containing protein [Treponema sp.]|jgi:uncharacterized protein YecE (DUF72 family)|nr:DUF72 domain-containing protein [Treponema sp.]
MKQNLDTEHGNVPRCLAQPPGGPSAQILRESRKIIQIGTSGYAYAEWVGPVYPAGTKPDAYLHTYAGLFATVELNYSYYRMPSAEQLAGLMRKAPGTLSFSIKAHASLTHKRDQFTWKEQAQAFLDAVEPLRQAQRLEAALFQFPYSFHYEPENRRYLDRLLGAFREIPRVVEFRNAQWYQDRVIDGLRERPVTLAAVDLPALAGLPPTLEQVTSPLGYIRLHGRNKEAWWGADGAARYAYRYDEGELHGWGERIRRMQTQAERILVYFNNHPQGQAAVNAQRLQELLGVG